MLSAGLVTFHGQGKGNQIFFLINFTAANLPRWTTTAYSPYP